MKKQTISTLLIFTVMFGFQSGCSGQHEQTPQHTINRQPAAAGRFYSDDPVELRSMLEQFFASAKPGQYSPVAAVISPHAGYVFSGEVAAQAFAQIDPDRSFDNVFVLASSHQVHFRGASIYNQGDYVTPLGVVPVNRVLADSLIREYPVFQFNPEADKTEHSLEVQIPFLQVHLRKPFQLVPIVLGTQSPESCRKIAEALLPWFNERNLFVISSDFSHYPSYADAQKTDSATCNAIVSGSPETFLTYLERSKKQPVRGLATNCCGWTSVLTLLYMTTDAGGYTYKPVIYKNSGDSPYGERQQVVGYWAIAVYRDPASGEEKNSEAFSFTREEQLQLISLARETINGWIRNGKVPVVNPGDLSPALLQEAGAFVTLHKDGALRGCIGRFTADMPLYRVVQEMAVAAATEDPRFPPVSAKEIDRLDIEISVLSPMRKIRDMNEIVLGKHGIYIKKGYASGTFLPQVATETGWDLEEFLGHCSRDKAGIGWDGWKEAEVYVYEAKVFGED